MTRRSAEPNAAEAAKPPRNRVLSCLWLGFKLSLYSAVLCVLGGAVLAVFLYVRVTGSGTPGETVRVTIPQGATGRDVGALLAKNGLIEHPVLFRIATQLDRSKAPIKQGTYDLPHGLSASELLRLVQGGVTARLTPEEIPDERKVTAPEGLSLAQMAQIFSAPQAFLDAASDPKLIASLGIQAATLEGFLMPDTYFFDEKPTERQVVERMVEQFRKEYAALIEKSPNSAGQDVFRVVTIASLIEREAKVPQERSLVSAVIYNRLKENMPLGLDCTLQYALNKYGQPMLNEDKEVDSPYNTYVHVGLPPGPIASPGVECLRAALEPAEVDYRYFVSNADGKTHTFSRELSEHERARARYQREIAIQRRQLKQQALQDEPQQ